MQDIEAIFSAAVAFADAHPLLTWVAVTAALNTAGRLWPRFAETPPGRVIVGICSGLGVDPHAAIRFAAAGAGARALGLAATGLGTTPEALQGVVPGAPQPPADRPTEPPTDATPPPVSGGLGRRL